MLTFLTVEIKGQDYGVESFTTCNGDKVVRLTKGDDTVYDVTEGAERTTCDCPDFQRRHADLPYSDGCKHVRSMVEHGLVMNVKPWEPTEADVPAECGVSGVWFAAGSVETVEVAEIEVVDAAQPAAAGVAVAVAELAVEAGLVLAIDELQDDAIYAAVVEVAPPCPIATVRRGRGRPTVADHVDWDAAGRRYAAGESYRGLAAELGVKPNTLYTKVRKLGYRPEAALVGV